MKHLSRKEYIIAALIFVVGFIAYRYTLYNFLVEEPEEETRCEFVIKTTGKDFVLTEQAAGTYKYELYTTVDGSIEVWKCK